MAKSKEKFDFDAFFASVRKKSFAPVYFFYGEEKFLIDECVDAIVQYAVDPAMKEFNFDLLQGSDVDAKKVIGIASSYPMMAERRVVIVKEFERTVRKDAEEIYAAYFDNPSPTTLLVLIASSADFRKKPYTALKAKAVTAECRPFYDNDAVAWIESRVRQMKRAIEPQATALLHSYVGNSLRELSNEIEKVMISIGERQKIAVTDIEHVVGVSREFSSFELANKMGEKNIAKAIEISDRLIRSGESAVAIVAAITVHFVKLYKIHDGLRQRKPENELASIAGVHPFFLKSYLAHARNYRTGEIENAFVVLSEADLALKSSADPKIVLTKAVTEIVSGIIHESLAV